MERRGKTTYLKKKCTHESRGGDFHAVYNGTKMRTIV